MPKHRMDPTAGPTIYPVDEFRAKFLEHMLVVLRQEGFLSG